MAKARSADTRYLEQTSGKWRVTVAVPRALQSKLGTRLKRPLNTDSLSIANHLKWAVVADLKAQIAREGGVVAEPFAAEALALAAQRILARSWEEKSEIDDTIIMRAEQIAGEPIRVEQDPLEGEVVVYGDGRERSATQFAAIAYGTAVPLDLHRPEYVKQITGRLTRRTVADDERALKFLKHWCVSKGLSATLSEITRRTASQFMDDLGTVSGAPSPVTHKKYITRLSVYWKWLVKRDIIQANPWADLKPDTKPTPYDEKERPFTDREVLAVLAGPATPAMHDLMQIAALTGARLDAIVDLKVKHCASGLFVFKPQKKEKGPRSIPIHSALHAVVAARIVGRAPDDDLFPEWPAPSNPESHRERSFKASNAFTTYRRSIGVDETVPGRRRGLVNFHSFRRWFITKAEQAGQPESIIASVVGHTRPGMTFGRYSAGPQVEQLRACVEAVQLPQWKKPNL